MSDRASAESLKIAIGSAHPESRPAGRCARARPVTGLPRSLTVTTQQVAQALEEPLQIILQGVKQVLERTPPELAGDIIERKLC